MTEAEAGPDSGALILRLAAGERGALRALLAAEGPRLYGLCLRHGGAAGAPALFERVWAAVWDGAPDFAASHLPGGDWLVLVLRLVLVAERRAARRGRGQDDLDRLADLPPVLPAQGPLAPCLARLPAEEAEAVIRALEDGETEAELARRFGLPDGVMRHWLDRALSAADRCLGGDGGTLAARQVLGLATAAEAGEFREALALDPALIAGQARWAQAVAATLEAPPVPPPAALPARVERRLRARSGGGLLRRLGLVPSLVAALIGALLLLWIGDLGGEPPGVPLGEPLSDTSGD